MYILTVGPRYRDHLENASWWILYTGPMNKSDEFCSVLVFRIEGSFFRLFTCVKVQEPALNLAHVLIEMKTRPASGKCEVLDGYLLSVQL